MLKGRIHSFESFGAVDGPGIRYIVFFQGCPLRCRFCHNPDTWSLGSGEEYTVDEIVAKILPYKGFHRNGGGVTLSGGEPMAQHAFAAALCQKLRELGIHTAIDTSGGIPLSVCKDAVDAADMLLLDIKSIDPELSADITGNGTTLANEKEILAYCEAQGKPVWIRHVVVPGLTMRDDHLRALREFLDGFDCVKKIEPLPFHKLGEHKWLPELYTLTDTEAPTAEEMDKVRAILAKG